MRSPPLTCISFSSFLSFFVFFFLFVCLFVFLFVCLFVFLLYKDVEAEFKQNFEDI